jgi:tetratricopeptide (TPR) repeat protein
MRAACSACAAAVLAFLSFWPAAWGFAHAEIGSVIGNVEMPVLGGGRQPLLSNAEANVFIFFKPGQEHSRATMKQIALLEKEMAGKSVRWVGIVSDKVPKADALSEAKEAGIAMPVLVDADDALYGRLGVALQPVVGIADRNHELVAYQPFAKINYIEVIRARIRHLLREIDDRELAQALHPPVATLSDDTAAARRRLTLAEKLLRAKNYDKALESVKFSIKKDPTLAAAHTLQGDIFAAKGNCVEALQAYERALRLDPTDTHALEGRKACKEKEMNPKPPAEHPG